MIQNVGSQALNQLPTKIRPKRKYKTDRKDLDGGSSSTITSVVNLGQKFAGLVAPLTKPVFKRYWSGDLAKGAFNTRDGFFSKDIWAPGDYWTWRKNGKRYRTHLKAPFETYDESGKIIPAEKAREMIGGSLDIQKQLSKLGELHMRTPTMKKYNYCGPGTKLEERLASNDPKIRDPINNLHAICQKHDIAYSEAKSLKDKHDVMLDEISKIPYMKHPWGTTAVQAMIAGKRKLSLGVKQRKTKNGKGRRVKKKTGKKN